MSKKRVLLVAGYGAGDSGAVAGKYEESELVNEFSSHAGTFVANSRAELSKFYNDRGVKTQELLNPNVARARGVQYGYMELFFLDNKSDLDIYLKNKSGTIDGQWLLLLKH